MPLALAGRRSCACSQERTFERVGGNETIRTRRPRDRRRRTATSGARRRGQFRADLYYRLGVFTIDLPPLRERGDDDRRRSCSYYVRRFSARARPRDRAGRARRRCSGSRAYAWPGNIRELQSVIRQALLRASGTVLLPAFLPPLGRSPRRAAERAGSPSGVRSRALHPRAARVPATNDLYGETHREVDRLLITHALEFTHGNHRDAATAARHLAPDDAHANARTRAARRVARRLRR